jgi:molybdopterin converting factor small subunit
VEVELPEGATVGQLRKRLAVEVPALANTIDRMMFALGVDYAGDGDPVTADVEVACFPPVSGG